MRNVWKIFIGVIVAIILVMVGISAAYSDGEPYQVLPDKIVFDKPIPDNGHVNIRVDGEQYNWHFEGKCVTKTDHECANVRNARVGLTLHEEALLIGKFELPLNLNPGQCIEWVQYSLENYHFGENGEPPVCVPNEEPPVEEPPVEEPPLENPPVDEPEEPVAPTPPVKIDTAVKGYTGED